MFKNFLILSIFLFLNNCGVPGGALLGPAFTGATTKSAARSAVSFGSNQIIKGLVKLPENKENKDLIKFHD